MEDTPGSFAVEEDGEPVLLETGKPDQYMRDLQKALTQCKKAEAKLRRLQETKATREKQWQQYQRDLKKVFLDQQSIQQRCWRSRAGVGAGTQRQSPG